MKKQATLRSLLLGLVVFCWAPAALAEVPEDHEDVSDELELPVTAPMQITKACLSCHEETAAEVMATTHWTWSDEQEVAGKGRVNYGKRNAFNNFCISVSGNEPRCTSCHAGYGWRDSTFDFTDESRVDCLVCHDTTGTYQKHPKHAGMPAGFTGDPKIDANPVDLVHVAENAGPPTRQNCLSCHANGGGGNNVKHGDIDTSLISPSVAIDVHMAPKGEDFTCQDCHATKEHAISGHALVVSPGKSIQIGCTGCHDTDDVHPKLGRILSKHLDRVACQTCHIPRFAKKNATKMTWDWSAAKDPASLPADEREIVEDGHPVYVAMKGRFTYAKDVVPEYAWYDGHAEMYALGQAIDPSAVTTLNAPVATRGSEDAKIHPFKVHRGKQIYDAKQKILIPPKLFPSGDDAAEAFWKSFDWARAAAAGMKASGLEFSGEYGFAATASWWPINHMVSPRSEALGCRDCHPKTGQGRLDWKALGYDGDPRYTRRKTHR